MVVRLLFVGFLLAHAVIHTGFISPRPAPAAGAPPWPFDLTRSWLLEPIQLDPGIGRVIGVVLLAGVVAGYLVAALATLQVLPATTFALGVAIGSGSSIALLVVFFHPWLVLGVTIDLVLLWAALVIGWVPEGVRH